MKKVNLISKFNTLPDQDLDEIEKSLDISIWTVKSEEKWKLTLEEILTLKVKSEFWLKFLLQEIVIFA